MVGPPTSSTFTKASHGQLEMPLVEGMDLVALGPEQVSTLVLVGPPPFLAQELMPFSTWRGRQMSASLDATFSVEAQVCATTSTLQLRSIFCAADKDLFDQNIALIALAQESLPLSTVSVNTFVLHSST